ncbi:HEAT repeat domain-containing protein [Verrucomicrobiales bacterium]|nr:HEAT repeat domain-containing protein [Verrucomicrobiales bacterium]MDC0291954.1 HEAT repeat domain-containing protein [Verrucomicrobiales bacterium]
MKYTLLIFSTLGAGIAFSQDRDLTKDNKQLPTVAEANLPELSNKVEPFKGIIGHKELQGHTFVKFPFVENGASLDIDPQGRIYVGETNRFWLGVPDLRGANRMIREDFQAKTVQDRLDMYERHKDFFPKGWLTNAADRIVRLEDRDGNGAADHRTLFSDHFRQAESGIGFSILAERDAVYFTCIPAVWKMTDANDDGVADTHDKVVDGFGVRVSFIGHDLHGIIRGPDGRLYFSIGDRGFNVTTKEGKTQSASGRGAIFRCDDDGSNFEVFAHGLRNPQELTFDDHGNLFTFDNTGDIGDKARFVYVVENSDSGWDMSHQSAHHYAEVLDWGKFRPKLSMWVAERMFDTWNEEQPQWVYPPASHVGNGPSGVEWMTGDAIPGNLRGEFLMVNYRGAANNCAVLAVGMKPWGAGYTSTTVRSIVSGVGVADVELGYDGKLYMADFGAGWSINNNASVQVAEAKDEALRERGAAVAKLVKTGLSKTEANEVAALLGHADQRVRQMAQFELVKRSDSATLEKIATDATANELARLHAVWGLGQLIRQEKAKPEALLSLLADETTEVRANVIRALGDCRASSAKDALVAQLGDESLRIRALAAVSLGRVASQSDTAVIDALYSTNVEPTDVVLRHSILSALDRIGTDEAAVARVKSDKREERLLAVLFLRRHESEKVAKFLADSDAQIRREVIRAIYDTAILDSDAGNQLAALDPAEYPETIQRRIVAANYRIGQSENAKTLVSLAGNKEVAKPVRLAALEGLHKWEATIDTDPVLGHYRPQVNKERPMKSLGEMVQKELLSFISAKQDSDLKALAVGLASIAEVPMDEKTLREQVGDLSLASAVRVALLDNLAGLNHEEDNTLVTAFLKDKSAAVRASAIRHAFTRKLEGIDKVAKREISEGSLLPARASIAGSDPAILESLWNSKDKALRKALWLDVYQGLVVAGNADVATWATAKIGNPQRLAEQGGDPVRGEQVYRNQGACMQCHKIGSEGGIQGPELTQVHKRIKADQILESLIDPNAVISEGYGMSSVKLKDGTSTMGRVAKKNDAEMVLIAVDGTETRVKTSDVDEVTPPVSAMPPMGMALPLEDLRDLVAYVASSTKGKKKKNGESHGESEEERTAK